jgi:alkylation response protein AidB-like acyl-CoA dehydrogenase
VVRQRLAGLRAEESIRAWTNRRLRGGPLTSIGKVHQGDLNQRIQLAAVDLLGAGAMAWDGPRLDRTVKGMLRSRANTIEGGTTEVNKNVVGERVLGLPREPDPWRASPWRETPRN